MGRRQPKIGPPKPSLLVCALFEDGGRYFFLERKDERGIAFIDLPHVLLHGGEDPVSSLSAHLHSSLSIDAQVHLVSLRGQYNAGSRKRRHLIAALAFSCSAKRIQPKLPAPYSAFRWLKAEDSLKMRLGRNTEWLASARKSI